MIQEPIVRVSGMLMSGQDPNRDRKGLVLENRVMGSNVVSSATGFSATRGFRPPHQNYHPIFNQLFFNHYILKINVRKTTINRAI